MVSMLTIDTIDQLNLIKVPHLESSLFCRDFSIDIQSEVVKAD